MPLDMIDVKILEVLQENARVSISELSKKVNLSLSAVSERLKKLEMNGVIEQYTAILNAKSMGKHLTIIMMLNMHEEIVEGFEDFIKQEEDILECYTVTGDFDYAIKICTKNTESFEELTARMRKVVPIDRRRTIVILSKLKENHSVSPVALK